MAAKPIFNLDRLNGVLQEATTVYDAYNRPTFVSQEMALVPRRELEIVVGGLPNM